MAGMKLSVKLYLRKIDHGLTRNGVEILRIYMDKFKKNRVNLSNP